MLTSAPVEPVAPGAEVLPGYRVVGLLARGGRVDTYDVVSVERDCRCVVKVVRPDRRHEPHVVEALRTEGRLVTALAHPHLVRGYGVVDGPTVGLVLETLPGRTLDDLLDDGPLDPGDVLELGRQLASALAYLHRHGWVHLDVKPENVVVTDGGRAVLLDLGVAARVGREACGTGTDGYLAPEQAGLRPGAVAAACDVWGLGATLYDAAVAEPPGDDPDLARVPARLRPLLAACLRPDPRRRITFADLVTALRAAPAA